MIQRKNTYSKIALPKRNAIKKDISEAEYNDLQKAKRNAEYFTMQISSVLYGEL